MTLVQITNYTSPNCTDRPQVNIHCIENFFPVHDFWATCACPEKTEYPWKFSLYCIYFLHLGFLTTCACPENRVSPEIFHCIENIFYHSGFLSNFALALKKQSCPEMFRCMEYTFTFTIFEQFACACPEKQSCPDIFHCIWTCIFCHSGFLSNLHALALKNRVAQKFFAVWNILFTFQIWATCACPEKQRVPWIYCTEYIFFIIQEFWVTCACPEKQSCPDIFHCIEYTLYMQNFWATCACPEKQSCPEIFHCMEYTFTFTIFEQLVLALKNRVALMFSLY